MKQRLGFTIIEIIVVITAIAILAGIGTVSYSALQVRARDNERQADIDTLAAAFETYYEQKGVYPSFREVLNNDGYAPGCTQACGVPFLTNSLRLPSSSYVVPGAGAGTVSSLNWSNSAPTDASVYNYWAINNGGGTCWEPYNSPADTSIAAYSVTYKCSSFILRAMKEQDGSVIEKRSKYGW